MKIKLIAALTMTSLALSGCGMFGDDGMFRNRGKDYLLSEEMPPLVVPEGLDSEGLGQLYPIPPIAETAVLDESGEVPRPQTVAANSFEEVVKIQTLGEERWILSNRGPSEVWPRVRNILNRSGIHTARADAAKGELDTVWLEFQGDTSHHHRYRFFIQPGVQLNSTEIKLLHDQMPQGGKAPSEWPATSADVKREQDMLQILAEAMAGDASSGTVSLLAQNIGGAEKVEIITPKVADPYLLMKLDMDRAWASVAYSLQRGGFTTIDQDQSGGIFYINYTPEEDDEPGFFGRLLGRDEKIIEINYVVVLTAVDDGVQIRVMNKDRAGLDRADAIRLLKNVRANLS
ncbi:MAG: outer membrane protein assembly factor BamC [Porticoccaceae bacterium]|jgi:outer membrane protein assembly factor BamC|nr:outer membrane protein assembly factor BamC [Porticoccaceae bacterium]HLS98155.1 outer membrane protein assembly factor BamC [Porticoccaceae bacterium]